MYFDKCSIFQGDYDSGHSLICKIYVKPHLTFQGGTVFGKAVRSLTEFAKTVLGLMICSLFCGKQLLYKRLLVTGLGAKFQYDQAIQTIKITKIAVVLFMLFFVTVSFK